MARRLMAGHRSLAPAVMVRIHPGQLFVRRLLAVVGVAWACGNPLDLEAASGPTSFAAPWGAPILHQQPDQRPPADSSSIHREAEVAQARFERVRRRLLPEVRDEGRRPCEERVGRLCFWHGGEDDWELIPDPSDLVDARDELLNNLEAAAAHIPGDEWILGQRIRYMGEAGRWDAAVALAGVCGGADPSWCGVLQGFALHGTGRYQAALESFERAFDNMDSERARKWRDPSVLLDRRGSRLLSDAASGRDVDPETERDAAPEPSPALPDGWEKVRTRVWALADPLYLVPGNDRESEHYARWAFSAMNDQARNAWGMSWGDDLEELTVRYGWERGWERVRQGIGDFGTAPSVIGHQLPGGREFAPPGRVLEAPSETVLDAWIPEEERPQNMHVPAYAPVFLPGVAQVAVFHRGDSILVAASTEVPANSDTMPTRSTNWGPRTDSALAEGPTPWPQPVLLSGPEQIGLFLVDQEGRISGTSRPLREGALHLTVPADRYLVSVEAWAPEEGLGARIRHGIKTETIPDDLATLSDLVLLHKEGSLPESVAAALTSMRASTSLEADAELVLGWEVFGLGWREEVVSFDLSFSREGESLFGSLGRWLGFGGGQKPLQIQWSEPGPSEIGPWFRSVEVFVPQVDPGKYVFRLSVTTPGREGVVRTRLVEIVP